jgi:hypothetical protein
MVFTQWNRVLTFSLTRLNNVNINIKKSKDAQLISVLCPHSPLIPVVSAPEKKIVAHHFLARCALAILRRISNQEWQNKRQPRLHDFPGLLDLAIPSSFLSIYM